MEAKIRNKSECGLYSCDWGSLLDHPSRCVRGALAH